MRLSTRLSLSYIGFVALLGVLVVLLAGFQVSRLARHAQTLPAPASPGDVFQMAAHLSANGLSAPLPPDLTKETLAFGGWIQVLDPTGREVAATGAPADRLTAYSPADLAALDSNPPPTRWTCQIASVPGPAGPAGVIVVAVPASVQPRISAFLPPTILEAFWRYFLGGFALAVVAAVALSLAAGFWYARYLARPLVRLSAELKTAAAGDFSHRLPVRGTDEYAALTGAYNHLAEQLQQAEQERGRMEQARRDLVANISHDLRTPLTSIQGFTERLADAGTPPEERQRYAAIVSARIQELDQLLADLLELSRLQALPELKREPVDLPELAREEIIALLPEIEQARLEMVVDLPEGLPPVSGDARLIRRALQNLLVNALRHSSGATRLAVSTLRTGDGLALQVTDDGQGIPAREVPMLFERYYRGTSTTAHGRGTGLGLAIVRQIAEGHGGNITVETAEGRGTAFTLWLPVQAPVR